MILITGATGNVGRPLVTQLLARGAKVRAISRQPNTAGLPHGTEVVQADPSRPIRFEEVPPEVARQAMLAQGFPEGFVTGYLLLQAEAVDRPAPVSHTVEEILGRPATDFATWAVDHAQSFHGIAA